MSSELALRCADTDADEGQSGGHFWKPAGTGSGGSRASLRASRGCASTPLSRRCRLSRMRTGSQAADRIQAEIVRGCWGSPARRWRPKLTRSSPGVREGRARIAEQVGNEGRTRPSWWKANRGRAVPRGQSRGRSLRRVGLVSRLCPASASFAVPKRTEPWVSRGRDAKRETQMRPNRPGKEVRAAGDQDGRQHQPEHRRFPSVRLAGDGMQQGERQPGPSPASLPSTNAGGAHCR